MMGINVFIHHEASSHFVLKSLFEGKLNLNYIKHLQQYCDFSIYNEGVYSPFGIGFYATLMPFWLLLPKITFQGLTAIFFLLVSFIALYKIAIKMGLPENKSLWLLFFLASGTSIFPLVIASNSIPSFTIQIIGFAYLTLAILEYFYQKRFWLIGLLLMLAFLTRPPLILGSVFFILKIITEKYSLKQKIKNLSILFIPLSLGVIIFAYYNFARFGTIFETGYQYQNVLIKNYGTNPVLLSFKNIFKNLYYFLLAPPTLIKGFPFFKPNGMGTGLLFISPVLFLTLFTLKKFKNVWISWTTVLVMSIIPLMWIDPGQWQIGYRFAVDFFPFLFLILFYFIRQNKLSKLTFALLVFGTLAAISLSINDALFEWQNFIGLR